MPYPSPGRAPWSSRIVRLNHRVLLRRNHRFGRCEVLIRWFQGNKLVVDWAAAVGR